MQNSILLLIFSLQFEIHVDVLKLLLTTIGKRLQCTRHNFFGNLIFDVKIKTHLKTVRSSKFLDFVPHMFEPLFFLNAKPLDAIS